MVSLILSFLLLVLRISLDSSLNAGYKDIGFSKALFKNGFELISSRRDGTVIFNLGLVLLPIEINPILKKQHCTKDALGARGNGFVKMVHALLTKIITLYMGAIIVQVGIPGLEWRILGYEICLELTILFASNEQF